MGLIAREVIVGYETDEDGNEDYSRPIVETEYIDDGLDEYTGDSTGTTSDPAALPADDAGAEAWRDWFKTHGSDYYNDAGQKPVEIPTDVWGTLSTATKGLFDAAAKKLFKYDPQKPWQENLINALTSPTGGAILGGVVASKFDTAPPTGGGYGQVVAQPAKALEATKVQTRYGPIMRYTQEGDAPPATSTAWVRENQGAAIPAADGGLMRAYRQGGPVAMEDGGFVMTKRSIDGAGGPRGIQRLVPGARMVRGPGTGTSDSIPAYIQGPHGRTPARLSNGEAYVPRRVVQDNGGAQGMYALMKYLERSRG